MHHVLNVTRRSEQDMGSKKEMIARMVEAEWKMFSTVSNIGGGKASCQEDYVTFEINRSSQFMSWSEAAIESYSEDLAKAKEEGRNLCAEKFARMMQSTLPEEYAAIADSLPPLAYEVPLLIEMITNIVLEWEDALKAKYPDISRRMRPLRKSNDSPSVISVETYLKGELATYSVRTLELYCEYILEQKAAQENGAEVVLLEMMKRYGFKTLEEANEQLKAQNQ